MELPKFILGDNTDYPEAIFIVHTEFPRFIINLEGGKEWTDGTEATTDATALG